MPSTAALAAPSCLRLVENDRIVWTIGDDEAGTASKSSSTSTTTSTSFIKSRPPGAYTTARTSGRGTRVFDLSKHVERLAESAALLGGGGGSGEGAALLPIPPLALSDATLLRPRVLSLLRLGLFGDSGPRDSAGSDPALGTGEFRATILATWGSEEEEATEKDSSSSFSLSLHIAPLPAPPKQPIVALIVPSTASNGSSGGITSRVGGQGGGGRGGKGGVDGGDGVVAVSSRGGKRKRASAKSSTWVSERASLEREAKAAGAEEVLLVEREEEAEAEAEEEGKGKETRTLIFEGLSSNFAAVSKQDNSIEADNDETLYGRGYELQTAPEGTVLSGTIRSLLLDVVAPRAGFSIRRRQKGEKQKDSESQPRAFAPPCVEDAAQGKWVGALLLSTSRLALPVAELREKDTLVAATEGEEEGVTTSLVARLFEKGHNPHPVVARLSEDVAAALEGASESLLEEG